MHRVRLIIAGVLLGIIASASTQEAHVLRLQLDVGQKFLFSFSQLNQTTMEDGQTVDVKVQMEISMLVKSKAKEIYTFDSKISEIKTQIGDGDAIVSPDREVELKQKVTGEILSMVVKGMGEVGVPTSFIYPNIAVDVGDRWTRTEPESFLTGVPELKMNFEILDKVNYKGREVFVIGHYQDPSADGSLRVNGTTYIDIKNGMALKLDTRMSMTDEGVTTNVSIKQELIK